MGIGRAVVAGLAAVLALTSCSSTGGGSTQSGLRAALASVPYSGPAAQYFEYGSFRTLRVIGAIGPGARIQPEWRAIVGLGASSLGSAEPNLRRITGIDVLGADRAVTIGRAPDVAVRLDGSFDAAAIRAKLRNLGAQPRTFGTTSGLSLASDNKIDPTSALTERTGLINQLDQIVVTADHVAASPNSAGVENVLGAGAQRPFAAGTSLLDTDPFRSFADCLGNPLAAVITAEAGDPDVGRIGVAVEAPQGGRQRHEVVCLQPTRGKQSIVRAAVAKRVAPRSIDVLSNAPMSTYITTASVTDSGPLVRVDFTIRPGRPAGFVVEALAEDIRTWDGTCTRPQLMHHEAGC